MRPTPASLTRLAVPLLALVLVSAHAAEISPQTVGSLGVRWTRALGPVTGPLVVEGDTLYAAGWSGGRFYALDLVTGANKWSATVPGLLFGGTLVLPDTVCAGAGTFVTCVDKATGAERWTRNVGNPDFPDAIWSAPNAANGRLFVSIASISDDPCTRGRLIALDLATGDLLWTHQTVPDKICTTDTGTECDDDGDCPSGGSCVIGRGAGVTATVAVDPTGAFVYMNTVGCFSFPSIGDSETMFKLNAATGETIWKNRVTPPEQFGYCANDGSVDCNLDADCAGVGGTCTNPKAGYHDFGFLNGPHRLVLPGATLILSAAKSGTLYAFDEQTGTIVWENAVQPTPISPGTAGFGLFNGALAVSGDRVYAALNSLIPSRVCANDHRVGCTSDAQCPGGICLPAPEHLQAFDASNAGATLWTHEIGSSWSSASVANGVVFAGTNTKAADDSSEFFAVDAASGTRLATYRVPAPSIGRATVAGDTVFVPYGTLSTPGTGGVVALSLCGNGVLDAGEACDFAAADAADCCTLACTPAAAGTACGTDDGNVCTDAACDGAGLCVTTSNTAFCDDGDACTSGDVCAAGACAGAVGTRADLDCALAGLTAASCDGAPLPKGLAKALAKRTRGATKQLNKATALAAKGAASAKIEKRRQAAARQLDGVAALTAKAVRARNAKKRIAESCKATLDAIAARSRAAIAGFGF
ncbi:MAG: PQQ-binding-like beta-propeller repeat protein [bacterium]|nr:PQQ-binding-like beta-propeller repeat protein [bacterium]